MAGSANFEIYTFNKTYSVLIRKCLEMPNAPYLNVGCNTKHLKKIIFNKYFNSNWNSDIGALVFCCISIYLVFFSDVKLSYGIGLSALSLVLLAKVSYHIHTIKLYFQNIKKAPLRTSGPHSEIDFYEKLKLRIIKKNSKIGIKEKLSSPNLLNIESVNKETDSIIILKSTWRDNIWRYGDYNIYYQIIYYNEKDALELICYKSSDVKINDKSFDFENFIKLGENFAHVLDLKYKVITNL